MSKFSDRKYLIASRSNNRDATAFVTFEDTLINDCSGSQWYYDNYVPYNEDDDFVLIPDATIEIVREYVDYDVAWSRMIEVPFDLPERPVLEAIIDQVPAEGMGVAQRAIVRHYGDRHAYDLDDLYWTDEDEEGE